MIAPQRITARLGDDFNWWIESGVSPASAARGVLDPRQVAHLIEVLDGYRPEQFADAFQSYRIDAEISEGMLRLAATDEDSDVFALPILVADDDGPYFDLLDAISAARIRKLNATHHYARQCTEDEMVEELETLDLDRYFSADSIHAFDEINEILKWSPAEWDESAERRSLCCSCRPVERIGRPSTAISARSPAPNSNPCSQTLTTPAVLLLAALRSPPTRSPLATTNCTSPRHRPFPTAHRPSAVSPSIPVTSVANGRVWKSASSFAARTARCRKLR